MRNRRKRKIKTPAEIIEAEVNELGFQGDGVAYFDGLPLYIPLSVPGDRLKVQITNRSKSALNGEIKEILESSSARALPKCRHFGECGGCKLQMLQDEDYRQWIKSRVTSVLSYHDLQVEELLKPMIVSAGERRRLGLKAIKEGNRVRLGFLKRRSHALVDVEECPIAHPELVRLFSPLRELFAAIISPGRQIALQMTMTSTGIDLYIELEKSPDLETRERLAAFAQDMKLASLVVSVDGFVEPIASLRTPMMRYGDVSVALPPGGFIQASAQGEEYMAREVTKAVSGATHAADLFSGIGTFTFPIAGTCTVDAYEASKSAIDALDSAARKHSPSKPVQAFHRDLYRRPLSALELEKYDFVVFDPPRAGAKEQAAELAISSVKTVVAVSCNPNSFARDARLLTDGGYKFRRLLPVDQFLWSGHLELVGVFSRD